MKIITLAITFLLLTLYVYSQDKTIAQTETYPMHQIGAVASSISGTGISYSFIFSDKMRFKLNGIYYYSKNNNDETDWSSIGLEFQHNFLKMKIFRVYGLIGGSYWYSKDNYSYNYYYPEYNTTNYLRTNSEFRLGIGLGFDLTFWDHFVMGADIGYDYEKGTKTDSYNNTPTTSTKYVGIAGGVTIGFLF